MLDNLATLEAAEETLAQQVVLQRILVDEAKFYATLPYEQLVDEIREMKAVLLDYHQGR